MGTYVEIPRPPSNCGAFIPPSQFEGGNKQHPGWRSTVLLPRDPLAELLRQHASGKIEGPLLWSLLQTHWVTPLLGVWLKEIEPLVLGT